MTGLIPNFPYNGVVTVNRVILKDGYSIDDLVLQPVPLPAAVWLFGSGLVMLLGVASVLSARR